MRNTDYFCPECHVESKDTIVNPIKNPDVIFCPECGWLIDLGVLEIQPNLKVKKPIELNNEMRSILQRCEDHLSDYTELLNDLREDEETGIDDLDKLTDEINLILKNDNPI